ncbi:Oidioi.mRNA.OKI2018_I69.chr1.g748.t1.cds [Oikopleura dioica]|uniref:Oidioi.mRNA.OKI2018_I69.chr1.g748.t1.cds n=1 Tax=Oikopleura dioica TaxID=34765 RepID=A0ABN7SSZ5_OIKDI|nr:Oidioi.mRNA.OKI2018_I69.chr1.g748.t1.cds [Oikopleura dioica]
MMKSVSKMKKEKEIKGEIKEEPVEVKEEPEGTFVGIAEKVKDNPRKAKTKKKIKDENSNKVPDKSHQVDLFATALATGDQIIEKQTKKKKSKKYKNSEGKKKIKEEGSRKDVKTEPDDSSYGESLQKEDRKKTLRPKKKDVRREAKIENASDETSEDSKLPQRKKQERKPKNPDFSKKKPFQCEVCGNRFKTKATLKAHTKKFHEEKTVKQEPNKEIKEEEMVNEEPIEGFVFKEPYLPRRFIPLNKPLNQFAKPPFIGPKTRQNDSKKT